MLDKAYVVLSLAEMGRGFLFASVSMVGKGEDGIRNRVKGKSVAL